MLKNSLLYLIASIVMVALAKYAHLIVAYIDQIYLYANLKLAPVFNYSSLGLMVRKILILTLLPIALAAVPALAYRAIKGNQMPHFMQLTWFLWLVIVMSVILVH